MFEEEKVIQAMMSSGYLPVSEIYAARFSQGRLEVPVAPSQVAYAGFRHVVGVAAEGGSGVPLDRLIILDRLIGQLESARAEPVAKPASPEKLAPSELDSLIGSYEDRLHTLAAASSLPYRSPVSVKSGIIVNLVA